MEIWFCFRRNFQCQLEDRCLEHKLSLRVWAIRICLIVSFRLHSQEGLLRSLIIRISFRISLGRFHRQILMRGIEWRRSSFQRNFIIIHRGWLVWARMIQLLLKRFRKEFKDSIKIWLQSSRKDKNEVRPYKLRELSLKEELSKIHLILMLKKELKKS